MIEAVEDSYPANDSILFYFRNYPTQEVMGFVFGVSQSQVCEWVKRLTVSPMVTLRRHSTF